MTCLKSVAVRSTCRRARRRNCHRKRGKMSSPSLTWVGGCFPHCPKNTYVSKNQQNTNTCEKCPANSETLSTDSTDISQCIYDYHAPTPFSSCLACPNTNGGAGRINQWGDCGWVGVTGVSSILRLIRASFSKTDGKRGEISKFRLFLQKNSRVPYGDRRLGRRKGEEEVVFTWTYSWFQSGLFDLWVNVL